MGFWTCQGCGTTYPDSDADCIVRHVADCDKVDGAGNPLKLYNVRVSVVDLLYAVSEAEAVNQLARRLTRSGFDVYAEGEEANDAFESEES